MIARSVCSPIRRPRARSSGAERLVVATGRDPNTGDLSLERAGVEVDGSGFVTVDAQLRTSQPHVWAAGDVIGRQHGSQMATHVGARQARIVADNAFADAGRPFEARSSRARSSPEHA